MSERCRICGETTHGTVAKDIFDPANDALVNQIGLLTGERLHYVQTLPYLICICCETDLHVAASFRDRCIATQKQLRATLKESSIENEQTYSEFPEQSKTVTCPSSKSSISSQDAATKTRLYHVNSTDFEHDMLLDMSDYDDDLFDDFDDDDDNFELHSIHEEDISSTFKDEIDISFQDEMNETKTSSMLSSTTADEKNNEVNFQSKKTLIKPKRKYINWRNYTEEEEIKLKRLMRRRDFICDQCGRHFNDGGNLKLHLLRHSGVKNFKCNTCGQLFYTVNLLKTHERSHTGILLYSCQYCEKKFSSSQNKLNHERRHRGDRRYPCKLCDKSFYTSGKLYEHQLVHTQTRNFYCEVCDKRFLCRKNLIAHNKSKFHKNNIK